MDITIIGHICKDYIHPKKNGKSAENIEPLWGGIFYAIATLANLASLKDSIMPIFSIGEKDYDELIERLRLYPNVSTEGIYRTKTPTNEVHLIYSAGQNRIECSKNIALSIPFKKIQPFLKADALLINMISGYDITLETLDFIRLAIREQDVQSFIDFHSLTLGINDDFTRFRTPLIEWRRWAFMMNHVQMNQEEAKSLTLERMDEDTLAKQLLSLDVASLLITKASKGATLYTLHHKNFFRFDSVPEEKIKPVDTTGCGDVFGASYLYHFLQNMDAVAAVTFATHVAGINAQYIGSSGIDTIAQTLTEEQFQKETKTQ